MKTNFTIRQISLALLLFIFGTLTLHAQSPESFNYQGVARNTSGGALVNQQINVRIAIVASNTAEEYVETHLVTTSSTGIFSLKIGTGTIVIGDFETIDWAEGGSKFIKTSIDENGGSNFKELGSVQLLSVPYALYAKKAATPDLAINGNTLSIEGGNSVTLPSGGGTPSEGKSFIFLSGNITDAEAQTKIATELGPNTSSVFVLNATQLTTLDLSGLSEVTDLKIINNPMLSSIDLSDLALVAGNIEIQENTQLQSLSFPELELVGGEDFDIDGNSLTSFSAPKLAIVDGIYFSDENQLTSISLPNLLNGYVDVDRSALIGSLSLPNLESGGIDVEECSNFTTLSAPVFSNGGLYISTNDILTTISLASYKKGYVSISGESITQINLSSLEEVSDFTVRSTKITTLDLSSLKKVTNYFEVAGNDQLSNVLLSNTGRVTSRSGETFSFGSNALTSASVNSVLSNLVTWTFNATNIRLNQSFSNPQPPTGQGLVDKQTLIDAGNNVQTD